MLDNDYKNLAIKILNNDGNSNPTETEITFKISELKTEKINNDNLINSAKSKLLALGLTEEEIKLTFGI